MSARRPLLGRRAAWSLAFGLLGAPAFAQPAPLCGVDATGVAAIHARVAADPRFKRDGGDATHEIWSAEAIQAIWTFVTASHPAFPAAICQQVIDKDGTMEIDRQVRCEGAAAACAALAADDDGPGGAE